MSDQSCSQLGDVARVVAYRIREDLKTVDSGSASWLGLMESHAKDLDRLADKLAAYPAEPAPVVTDEAVEKALDVVMDDGHNGLDCRPERDLGDTVRAALEAAAPLLGPQPVVDREALGKALRAELVEQGVDEFHDPAPLSRQLADAVLALINGGAK